ncbi:MAG: hypothetical protein WC449_01240 [Candidatus Paceibacterota bacterium]
MEKREIDKYYLGKTEDIYGTVLAVTCPVCGKVFITNGATDTEGRLCPACNRSTAFIDQYGGSPRVEWEA